MNDIEKRIKIKFTSLSPSLFCKMIPEEKLEGETPGDYEKRCWRSRAHYNEDGKVIIPGFLLKRTLEPAAKLLGKRVGGGKRGKGLAHYIRLIQIEGDIVTELNKDNIKGIEAFVASNGQKDSGKVSRTFPKVPKWEGTLTVVYPTIAGALNEDLVMEHLQVAGSYIGVGHWRPDSPSNGNYGRFSVEKIEETV